MINVWKGTTVASFKILGYFCLEKEIGKNTRKCAKIESF
jgi:hypothetical protein